MEQTGKGPRIRAMFDSLAPRYDMMNRLMTMGRDQAWRRYVVDKTEATDGHTLLDLASGTGDIAYEMRRRFPSSRIVAADFSIGMLEQGQRRAGGDRLAWVAADAMNLPFANNSFDAVTFGYLLRNVESVPRALAEIHRVLKPGGKAICLDTTPPPKGLIGWGVRTYLNLMLPLMGRIFAGDASAYAYLSDSTQGFQGPDELKDAFNAQGFTQTGFRTFMLRTIAVHWGAKAG